MELFWVNIKKNANNDTNNLQEKKKNANFAAPYEKLACMKNEV